MSRLGIVLTVLTLALIGFALYSLDPARPALSGKKRLPESSRQSSRATSESRKSSSAGQKSDDVAESTSSAGRSSAETDKEETSSKPPRYHLPYGPNVGYAVKSDPESPAILFEVPYGTLITSIRSGVVVGVTGWSPKPGEDLVFGRQLPRNAILIQHEDSTFALYQNVQSVGVDSGTVVSERAQIATMRSSGPLRITVSHLTREKFKWHFSTRQYPDGGYLRAGEVYLRSDSNLDHPVNAVEKIWTADAGNYRKTTFRPGETVRLHSSFRFPIRANVRYAIRPTRSSHLTYEDARLDPGRETAHADFRPDRSPGRRIAYLYFDDQPMDSLHFSIAASQ